MNSVFTSRHHRFEVLRDDNTGMITDYLIDDRRVGQLQFLAMLQKEKESEANVTLVQALKTLNVDANGLDDLLVLHMQARQLRAEYTESDIDVPEWLDGAINLLNREVERQSQDRLAKRLMELDRAEQGLLTASERREKIQQERARIQARMGKAPVPEPTTK